jgi:hypothetical protein
MRHAIEEAYTKTTGYNHPFTISLEEHQEHLLFCILYPEVVSSICDVPVRYMACDNYKTVLPCQFSFRAEK